MKKINVPDDMPVSIVEMLSTTISETWDEYDGDRDDAEQFWNYLTAY